MAQNNQPHEQPKVDPDQYWDFEETEECWQCNGEGGWASCQEDCCPHEGGEEMCLDPVCWRRCDVCKGKGHLK